MARAPVNIALDRDLLVILLYTASVNRRTLNEEIEEQLYSQVRAMAEADNDSATLSHLDDVYGQVHGYWESSKPHAEVRDNLPY